MDQPTQQIPRSKPVEPVEGATQAIPRPEPQQVPPAPPESKPPKPKRRFDLLSVGLVLIIVLALVAAGFSIGELYARHQADSKVAAAIECVTKDNASVSFAMVPPFLWQHVRGDYRDITITTAGNNIRSAKGMKAEISIEDVRLEGGQNGAGTIKNLAATISWPSDGIKQTVQEALPVVGSLVTGVKTDPTAKTIEMQGAFGSIIAKPTVENRVLKLQVMKINALGFPLPPEMVQSTLDKLTDQLANSYPLNVKPDSVDITDDGVVGHFSTQNADIPKDDQDVCFANL